MRVATDRYECRPEPVWGPGIGIISIKHIELDRYL